MTVVGRLSKKAREPDFGNVHVGDEGGTGIEGGGKLEE